MLGVLLESRARRQRRTGGAALSVAAHIAIIGAATVATLHGKQAEKETVKPDFIIFTPSPPPPPRLVRQRTTDQPRDAIRGAPPPIPTIDVVPPDFVPPSLPPINTGADTTPDLFTTRTAGRGSQTGRPGGLLDPAPEERSEWIGNEVLMHVLSSGKPRYPELLRQGGIDGRVLIQFTVDTLGRVEMNSVRVLKSTHDLFTDAVRASLSSFRFRPAQVGGRKVPALAEMPFEFQVRK